MNQSLDFGTWGAAMKPHREELGIVSEIQKRVSQLTHLANLFLNI
jgi:hypothetical protein